MEAGDRGVPFDLFVESFRKNHNIPQDACWFTRGVGSSIFQFSPYVRVGGAQFYSGED